jgi:hypothetical protein
VITLLILSSKLKIINLKIKKTKLWQLHMAHY